MYLGSWKIDGWLTFPCNTHTPSTGAVTDADAVPAYRIYEDETGTPIASGNTAKLDDSGTTGFYSERIQLLAAVGFEKGKTYTIRLSATVGGVTGAMSHSFQIEAEVDANTVSDKTGFGLTANQSTVTVGTVTTNTDMRGTDSANTVVPDAAGIAPTAVEIRQEMDTNSTRLDVDISSRSPASEYAGDMEDIRTLLGDGGDIFYVSKTGDDSDGTTWAKAKNTIDSAIALCTANQCNKIYISCGTYDEVSATAGVTCDVAGIKIIGAMPGVNVTNTNATNGSKVFSVTADDVWLRNLFITKGETASDDAICIDVNGSYISADIRDVTIAVEKANHTGIRFTGGAISCGYVNGPMSTSYIYSAAGVGIGIEAADCNNCVAIDAQFHTLDVGIDFTGGANCHNNMVSPGAMISSSGIGIRLNTGCLNNIISALILNCTDGYDDNSGNNTNKADGSLTYVLDDIKTHVDIGFDEVQGSGFVEVTDSLEALRNRGDSAWLTATGFNTVVPDVAGTAAALHATTDALVTGLEDLTVADIIAGISDGTYDLQEMQRIMFAVLSGKSTGGGTSTLAFRDPADGKDRLSESVDSNGNRTAVTRDGS